MVAALAIALGLTAVSCTTEPQDLSSLTGEWFSLNDFWEPSLTLDLLEGAAGILAGTGVIAHGAWQAEGVADGAYTHREVRITLAGPGHLGLGSYTGTRVDDNLIDGYFEGGIGSQGGAMRMKRLSQRLLEVAVAPGRFMLRRDPFSHLIGVVNSSRCALRIQRSRQPMILRKFWSASTNEAATQPTTVEPFRQWVTTRRMWSLAIAMLQSIDGRYPLGRDQGRSAAVRCSRLSPRGHTPPIKEEGPWVVALFLSSSH